jgi:hypothetical protein
MRFTRRSTLMNADSVDPLRLERGEGQGEVSNSSPQAAIQSAQAAGYSDWLAADDKGGIPADMGL